MVTKIRGNHHQAGLEHRLWTATTANLNPSGTLPSTRAHGDVTARRHRWSVASVILGRSGATIDQSQGISMEAYATSACSGRPKATRRLT
jgi:hypothetical protein